MSWFKKKKKKELSIPWMQLQVELTQCLLDNGYNWDQINEGLGISEVWYNHLKRKILEQG